MRFLQDDRVVDTTSGKKKTLQVIAAGLPRCATSSIQEAFESKWLDLGPSMHMAHVYPHTDRGELILAAIHEKDRATRQKMVRKLFDGHAASADFPGICFIEDLMDMYPDAPVVLNQRESPEAWAKSFGDSLSFFYSLPYRVATLLWKQDRLQSRMARECNAYFAERFGPNPETGDRTMTNNTAWYAAYNDMVRRAAKARGRPLLEWQPRDGWVPLCEFLGRPAPPADVPFPKVNDQKTIRILKAILVARGLLSWAALAGVFYAGSLYAPGLVGQGSSLLSSWLR
ncbi:uncharacterized protein B0I36DRAFT_86380 [Microdochium trichocladiopsis]|uniref:Uncharacterized protein n=1 Tax=Microdochium trichocladiopsis TaxID=1682393 RepID=A0A9P9BSM7_9PEZI|nr:uncharacterized protein B0I36DRAFT_86380 [Microdochium trichocladiopsis]KAH7034980.1 hypothetical protein B0I36DRAFT_86380 [Microdochium trichocladiopsis]